MSNLEVLKKAQELKSLKVMAEELEAEIKAIEDDLKAHMAANETDTLTIGEYKLKYTTVTSNRFDSKAFQTLHQNLYNQFVRTSEYMRFSVA